MEILLNWLWQGVAVALAAAVLLRITRRRVSATTRHHILWVALAVVLLLPLLPLLEGAQRARANRSVRRRPGRRRSAPAAISDQVIPVPTIVLPSLPAWSTLLFLLVCSSYTTLSGLRIVAALRSLGRIKGMARPFPASREADLKAWLAVRARGRAARLVISDDVRAAAVLGLGSPMIAVAPGALAALSAEELDHIVVHEWAHVQRRDDIAQLAQRIVVALTGLHPAVWWIDRQLRLERETACDDWAVNTKGSPQRLALCLTKLASLPRRPRRSVAHAFGIVRRRADDEGCPFTRRPAQYVDCAEAWPSGSGGARPPAWGVGLSRGAAHRDRDRERRSGSRAACSCQPPGTSRSGRRQPEGDDRGDTGCQSGADDSSRLGVP